MAAPSSTEILQSESTCSICLEFFTDPVVLACDHSFCRACIKQWLEEPENGSVSCPQCRHTCLWDRIKPNRLLVSVVEAAKQMRVPEAAHQQAGSVCELHNEELKLYCQGDEKLICTVCVCSREHRHHSVLPVEEAAVDYKKSFQHNLVDLKSKLQGLLTCRRSDEEIITYLKTEIETQRAVIKSELESLHMLLYEQEEMLLGKLEAAETSISMFDTKILTKRSEKIDGLNELILTIEASCQKPAKELMKDAKDFLARIYEELHEECNTTIVRSEGGMSGDKYDASTYPRIYDEVREWRNLTVPPCETEVSRDQHDASTCPRWDCVEYECPEDARRLDVSYVQDAGAETYVDNRN